MSFVDRYHERCQNDGAGNDEGFTLIELLVVLLIIGILLAIAIPTFLGVTKSANNTAAQSNLQTALTGAKAYFTSNTQSFTGIQMTPNPVSNIQAIDTGVSYLTGAQGSNNSHAVSIGVGPAGTGTWVNLASWSSATADCWGILDVTAAPTAAVLGLPAATSVGTYFWVTKSVTTRSGCTGAGVLSGASTTSSTTGFPPG